MLESYKELIAAKAEIKMLKKQLEESKPIIRCKDCRWFKEPGCAVYYKDFPEDAPKENDFCSFAVVKHDAQNNDPG